MIEVEDGAEEEERFAHDFCVLLHFRAAFRCSNFSSFSKLGSHFIFIDLILSA